MAHTRDGPSASARGNRSPQGFAQRRLNCGCMFYRLDNSAINTGTAPGGGDGRCLVGAAGPTIVII